MSNFEKAHKAVSQLVKDFQDHEKSYLSPDYSEAQARKDFIDKFFIALGWDVNHDEQKNPYEQEVKVEKSVSVAQVQKRADYSFCLAPNFRDSKYFVEAKKPARALANNDDYYQTARYGWNAGTPLCVLTDFEEFHIIDCRFKPNADTAQKMLLQKYHCSEYSDKDKFSKIYWLFSSQAVADNSIEKYAETLKKPAGKTIQRGLFPGGYQPIDEAFLGEIDEIRKTLAKAFKKNVPGMYSEELTEAVQRTIDRLVFIRFLEDKLIEPEYYIAKIGESGSAWSDFIALCRKLDTKYNGIVFKEHPIDLAEFEGPEDTDFRNICEELSHLNSPYDFNYIPIHIIGSIYERFLGKQVHATAKRVDIEEKPEVRKAGGVYYTPQYIVRYIVENTIGKVIAGKTPEEITKLRFADIACGSGSFLIGAFDILLEYHNKYYQNNQQKAIKDGCFQKDGKWMLSIKQKQNILINNIYGVDIDSQAVEVTQLSLALKMLEEVSTTTANEMKTKYHETVLPDLTKNIICGNSLIGTDILRGDLFDFNKNEERKINPMDFESVFPEIMKKGGFDAVIGNPPYVKARDYDKEKNSYRTYINKSNSFKTLYLMWDLYVPFMERALHLLRKKGIMGYIVPDTLEKADYTKLLKEYILNNFYVPQIDYFPHSYIFMSNNKRVGVKNIIVFIENNKGNKTIKIIHDEKYEKIKTKQITIYNKDIFSNYQIKINLLKNKTTKLGNVAFVSYGLRLNSDKNDKEYKFKKSELISSIKSERCWRQYTEGKYLTR